MALTKIQNTGIADDAVTTDKIENSTVLAADIAPGTITNAKLSNSSVTLNGTAVSLGGSTTLTVDWQAVTVADGSTTLTATAGKGYFLDTNTGVIEVFLPSSPTRGDTIILADYSGTFATNNCIINTGGQLIDSTTGPDFKLTTNNTIAELVYVDANKGWLPKLNQASTSIDIETYASFIAATGGTITTSGDYKIHTFTGDGDFIVSKVGNAAGSEKVSYMVVAGGGGSVKDRGGAGGAGGFREGKCSSDPYTASPLATTGLAVTAATFPVTVGGGGTGDGSPPFTKGNPGSNSVFSTITSTGGGGGGNACVGQPGGSGGGATNAQSGGAGNTPPVSPPQGQAGATGSPNSPPVGNGGGGGATQAGQAGLSSAGGDGGDGAQTSINASATYYAGGGGGGHDGSSKGEGGQGGGGDGANGPYPGSSVAAQCGTANTGGGAGGSNGGGNSVHEKTGGKGVVIIRYKFQ
tara:strand:+ start:592 stop:1989 length:1398 start_codon:yes stop_codon:yes gene_type:complete